MKACRAFDPGSNPGPGVYLPEKASPKNDFLQVFSDGFNCYFTLTAKRPRFPENELAEDPTGCIRPTV